MKRKKMVSVIAILLAVLMVMSLLVSVIPATAFAVSQADIDAVQARKRELSGKVEEARNRLEQLQLQQSNVLDQKAAISEQNRLTQEQIDLVQEQIDLYTSMIEEKAAEVEEARTREQRQLQRYRTRVRAMEENGDMNFLAVILQASDFAQLITAVDDMGEIMESDRVLEDQYIAAREQTEAVKAEYEAVKAEFEERQAGLRAEQEMLINQMNEANLYLEALSVEIEQAIADYKAAEAAEAAAAVEISSIIAEYNRQQAEAAANQRVEVTEEVVNPDGSVSYVTTTQPAAGGGAVSSTGSFVWPVPCSMRVTSRYGTRSDPFTGETAYHSGIDIDGFGNDGQPIVAADGGVVITASSNSGYGNYVIIDHGGTKTVYAHMSGFAVGAGQTVAQGQTVGYLGATGRATGTHLHFEVYVGDSRTDPAAYYSGINYYNC